MFAVLSGVQVEHTHSWARSAICIHAMAHVAVWIQPALYTKKLPSSWLAVQAFHETLTRPGSRFALIACCACTIGSGMGDASARATQKRGSKSDTFLDEVTLTIMYVKQL